MALGDAQTAAEVAAASVAAQTAATQATAAANQAASAASTATQAAQQTGAGQTDVSAGYRSGGAEVTSDVGQAEAYLLNMKHRVDQTLENDALLRQVAFESLRRSNRNAEDFDQTLRHLATQSLQSAVSLQNRVSNGSTDLDTRIKQNAVDHDGRVRATTESDLSENIRVGKVADDRTWNVNETDAISATLISAMVKNPVFQDAIAGAVAAAVAAAVSNKPSA